MSRKAALSLNVLIVLAYIAVSLLALTPWVMLAGFLLLAIIIRCATMCWITCVARREATLSRGAAFSVVVFNLILGLIVSAALVAFLYWLGHFWLSGVKIIVPVVAVFVAYKSTFPFLARSRDAPSVQQHIARFQLMPDLKSEKQN